MTTAQELLAPYADFMATQSEGHRIYGTTGYVALLHAEARHVAEVRNNMRTPHGGWKNDLPLEHNTLLGRVFKQLRTGDGTINAPGMREALNSADDELYKTAHGLMAAGMYVDEINWHRMSCDQIVKWLWDNHPLD